MAEVSLGGRPPSADRDLVQKVRQELADGFPRVDAGLIARIVRRAGRTRLPEALLVEGSIDDASPEGALARIQAASDPVRGRERDPHVLFSNQFYDFAHPAVRAAGIAPWLHFQVFGVTEGRSPSFLLDIDYLLQAIPDVPRSSVVDSYLTDPALWFASPSPYVNTERFVLSGEWDHRQHPLKQIITTNTHWLQSRLMLVDSAWGSDAQARLNGAGYLLSALGPVSEVSGLHAWTTSGVSLKPRESAFVGTVVPGFMVADDEGEAFALSDHGQSHDHTVVRLPHEHLALRSGKVLTMDRLVVLGGDLDSAQLADVLERAPGGTALAPFSRDQEIVLRAAAPSVAVVVLPWGVQARVRAGSLAVVAGEVDAGEPWDDAWDGDPRDVAIVVSRQQLDAWRAQLEKWITCGASLCLVDRDATDVAVWATTLARAGRVLAASRFVAAVMPYVRRSDVRLLSSSPGEAA